MEFLRFYLQILAHLIAYSLPKFVTLHHRILNTTHTRALSYFNYLLWLQEQIEIYTQTYKIIFNLLIIFETQLVEQKHSLKHGTMATK